MIVLEINNQVKARFNKKFLIKTSQRAGCCLKVKDRKTVSLALVSSATSQRLNKKYRGLNQPTDVLSFSPAKTKPFSSEYLGEIVICLPIARKQAKLEQTSIQAELARLMVHGLLHLTGFHHPTAGQRKKIEKLTAKILKN